MEELWLRIRPLFPTAKATIRAKPCHPWTAAGTPTLFFLPHQYLPTARASFQNRAPPPLSDSPTHLAHSCLRAFARLFLCPKSASPRFLHGQPSPLLPVLLTHCLLNTTHRATPLKIATLPAPPSPSPAPTLRFCGFVLFFAEALLPFSHFL